MTMGATFVLLAAFMHPERLQHFRRGSKPNGLALLLYGQSCQEDRHDPVLPERHAVLGVAGDLENELAIPAFVEKLARRKSPDRKPA